MTTPSSDTSSTSTPPPNADVQSFAQALFTAWSNNDRTAAAAVANQAAIDSLFAEPSSDAASWTFSGCRHVGSYYCTWTRAGGQIAMTASDTASGDPMQIIDVSIGAG